MLLLFCLCVIIRACVCACVCVCCYMSVVSLTVQEIAHLLELEETSLSSDLSQGYALKMLTCKNPPHLQHHILLTLLSPTFTFSPPPFNLKLYCSHF